MNGTLSDFARHIGVNKSSVTRAVQQGRIQREADGSIDFEKAKAAWHANSGGRGDVAARHAAQRGADIPKGQPQAENATAAHGAPAAGLDINLGEQSGRQKAQTTRMHFENQQIKLEMALRRGLRFDRAAVRRESIGGGAMDRSGGERMVDQTTPRYAACRDADLRRRMIEAQVRRLLRDGERELPRSLRRMKEAGQKVGASSSSMGTVE